MTWPNEAAICWVRFSIFGDNRVSSFASPGAGGSREKSKCLFDDGKGERKFIDEMRVLRDERRSSGDVGGENGIVFRTKPVQLRWMLGEEMKDVAHGAASSVVTREQKGFYLTGDEGFGGWIYDICCAVLRVFAGYFLQTSIQGKVNNRFVFSVVLAFVYLSHETILELFDNAAHQYKFESGLARMIT